MTKHGNSQIKNETSPAVTVCIINWNQMKLLRNTLHALKKNTDYEPVDFLVFDNGSNDNSVEMVKDEFPDVELLISPNNIGYPRALNIAFSKANTPLAVQVNSDVIVHKNWLTPLVKCLQSYPDVAMAGGRVLFPDGSTQFCGNLFGPTRMALSDWPFDPGEKLTDVGFHGPYFLIRKKVWQEAGGFEEGYSPGYGEDAEMGVSLRLAGWRVVFVPGSRVTHLVSRTASSLGRKKMMQISEKHRLRFVLRNYPTSWLLLHMSLEWTKILYALYKRYLPEYIRAWRDLFNEYDTITLRRKEIKMNPFYHQIFPSPLKMLKNSKDMMILQPILNVIRKNFFNKYQ